LVQGALATGRGQGRSQCDVAQDAQDSRRERPGVAGRNQQSRLAFDHPLADASHPARDHGAAGQHRFQHDARHSLGQRGEHARVGGLHDEQDANGG